MAKMRNSALLFGGKDAQFNSTIWLQRCAIPLHYLVVEMRHSATTSQYGSDSLTCLSPNTLAMSHLPKDIHDHSKPVGPTLYCKLTDSI